MLSLIRHRSYLLFFFFNDTATTEIYTLSLHDALPISAMPFACATRILWAWPRRAQARSLRRARTGDPNQAAAERRSRRLFRDRKSTRLNSSHGYISYAVFCLKKKKKDKPTSTQ